MTPPASEMTPAVWVALSMAGLAFLVQFIVVVRYLTLLGAKIDHHRELTSLQITVVTERVAKLERTIEAGKVVILRRPKDGDDPE